MDIRTSNLPSPYHIVYEISSINLSNSSSPSPDHWEVVGKGLEEAKETLLEVVAGRREIKFIVRDAMNQQNIVWTKTRFCKYVALGWFESCLCLFQHTDGLFYETSPSTWADDKSFVLKMNNALLELKIEEADNVKIEIELNYWKGGEIVRGEKIGYIYERLPNPSPYTHADCEQLVLDYIPIFDKFSKKFLGPILSPLSQGVSVRSR